MLTAATLVFGFCIPVVLALVAAGLNLFSVSRHMTVRQLLCAALLICANVTAVTLLWHQALLDQTIAVLPLLMIAAILVASIAQFGVAVLMGAITRLRRIAAS